LGLANALEYFVAAAEQLKEDARFHFILVGDGYLKAEFEAKTALWGNISFFNKIRKDQVQDLLTYFDVCFVGRSGSELFKHGVSANKYFDYMLSGKPILDSNNYIKDPVELSGCGLIVNPDSTDSIREGILQLASMSPEERFKMGQKGKVYVCKEHAIEQLATNYENYF
jgi:glycosyltransferase involved in cell wall biosynthesis